MTQATKRGTCMWGVLLLATAGAWAAGDQGGGAAPPKSIDAAQCLAEGGLVGLTLEAADAQSVSLDVLARNDDDGGPKPPRVTRGTIRVVSRDSAAAASQPADADAAGPNEDTSNDDAAQAQPAPIETGPEFIRRFMLGAVAFEKDLAAMDAQEYRTALRGAKKLAEALEASRDLRAIAAACDYRTGVMRVILSRMVVLGEDLPPEAEAFVSGVRTTKNWSRHVVAALEKAFPETGDRVRSLSTPLSRKNIYWVYRLLDDVTTWPPEKTVIGPAFMEVSGEQELIEGKLSPKGFAVLALSEEFQAIQLQCIVLLKNGAGRIAGGKGQVMRDAGRHVIPKLAAERLPFMETPITEILVWKLVTHPRRRWRSLWRLPIPETKP